MDKQLLKKLYLQEKKSVTEVSKTLNCSDRKIDYWIKKYKIPKRSISEAIYVKNNPNGDPFKLPEIDSNNSSFLFGLGLGLYWGEGTKSNKHAIRLGNTDPYLIKQFIKFLIEIYKVKKEKIKFGLQVFTDIDKNEALNYWVKTLNVKKEQFFPKIISTKSGSIGTYRKKSKYGVLTIYFSNSKLTNAIQTEIEKLREV